MQKIYSYELKKKVELHFNKEILEVLNKWGWNVFGVYEVVKNEIKKQPKITCPECGQKTDGRTAHGDCYYVIDKRGGWRQLGDYDG